MVEHSGVFLIACVVQTVWEDQWDVVMPMTNSISTTGLILCKRYLISNSVSTTGLILCKRYLMNNFDLVHQTISLCKRVGSGDETRHYSS